MDKVLFRCLYQLTKKMKFFKAFILFFIPLIAFTQSNIYSISKELKDTIIWTNYLKSNEVLI